MKKTVFDIREMSDSKEIYGQRPNPFIAIFLYCLVGLLVVAVLYCCIGEIEIVATASGLVRPNDDVSSISSLLSGRVTGVYYTNGQIVQEGDKLLAVDTSEMQISLDSLENTQEDYEQQIALLEKFVSGIQNGKNPFSSDVNGAEYSYYIQYQEYELSVKNSTDKFNYDVNTANSHIDSLNEQIAELKKRIDGLNAYRSSVEQGKNNASGYPEYERMYLLYCASIQAIDSEYQDQREKIELDGTASSNQYYLESYQSQLSEYTYLINSIEIGESTFPADDTSSCKYLYDDYVNNLNEYQRKYDSAKSIYEYYLNGGVSTGNESESLAYDKTMLEGYTYYKQSVENDTDMFDASRDSVFYRSLYVTYKSNYDALVNQSTEASNRYSELLADPNATEEDVHAALQAVNETEAAYDNYKTTTLSEINNSILQIEATIAQKELSISNGTLSYNAETAKAEMESAEAAIGAYRTKMLAEYKQVQSDLESKINNINQSISATQDKSILLSELDKSHQNSKEQQYYQTLTQIDSTLQTLQLELISAQSNLRLYQIASDMYRENVDENGVPLSLSLATIEQISNLLSRQETLNNQLSEVNTQIQQTKAKIAQGTILAERSGVINEVSACTTGDTLTSGTVIATIIPFDESEYKVQLYVSNADIANLKIGDPIKYNLLALPQSQYGLVEGYVTNISSDTLVQDRQYSGYYLVEGSIENVELSDRDGNSGSIAVGMQVEAKIVTQKKTIMRYLLEKINLF